MLRNKLFFRFLLTYVLIFMIPFTVFGMLNYRSSISELRVRLEAEVQDKIDTLADYYDTLFRDMQNISVRMAMDPMLNRYLVGKGGLASYDAVQELDKYKSGNDNISDILLYYSGSGSIYTSRGSYTRGRLLAYGYIPENGLDLYEIAKEDAFPHILPVQNFHIGYQTRSEKLMFCLFPINAYVEPDGSFSAYIVSESAFRPLFSNAFAGLQGEASLSFLGAPDAVVYHYGTEVEGAPEGEYVLFSKPLASFDYTIAARVSDQSLYAPAYASERTFLLQLALMWGLCIVLALAFALLNYTPLHRIVKRLGAKSGQPMDSSKNLYGLLNEAIEQMSEERRIAAEDYEQIYSLATEHILQSLLTGRLSKGTDLQDLKQAFKLHNPLFFVAVVSGRHRINRQLNHVVLEYDGVHCDCIGVEIDEYGISAYLFGITHGMPLRDVVYLWRQQDGGPQLLEGSVGVGGAYANLTSISTSFLEALTAASTTVPASPAPVIFYEDIEAGDTTSGWYPTEDELKLVQCLKLGREDLALEVLDRIRQNTRTQVRDIFLRQCVFNGIINIFARQMTELGITPEQKMVASAHFSTGWPDVDDQFGQYVHTICAAQNDRMRQSANKGYSSIIDDINRHYADHDLSLDLLSERHDLSISYLSRIIKKQTGQTFSDYLWSLRLDETKRQLVETGKPIKTIVQDVGYYDSPNFFRKFRLSVGISPGQYRSRHQQQPPQQAEEPQDE